MLAAAAVDGNHGEVTRVPRFNPSVMESPDFLDASLSCKWLFEIVEDLQNTLRLSARFLESDNFIVLEFQVFRLRALALSAGFVRLGVLAEDISANLAKPRAQYLRTQFINCLTELTYASNEAMDYFNQEK